MLDEELALVVLHVSGLRVGHARNQLEPFLHVALAREAVERKAKMLVRWARSRMVRPTTAAKTTTMGSQLRQRAALFSAIALPSSRRDASTTGPVARPRMTAQAVELAAARSGAQGDRVDEVPVAAQAVAWVITRSCGVISIGSLKFWRVKATECRKP
jgi:hypothetical protein